MKKTGSIGKVLITKKKYASKNRFLLITRPNCALERRTILCLYVPAFQRQVFKHVKILSERLKEMKEQKKINGSVLVAESAYNAQNAQFGLVMLSTESNQHPEITSLMSTHRRYFILTIRKQ